LVTAVAVGSAPVVGVYVVVVLRLYTSSDSSGRPYWSYVVRAVVR